MNPQARARQQRRGVAAVEFALWLTIMVTLLGGMVDVGYWLNIYLSVEQAARTGARVGSTVLEPFPATGASIRAAADTATRNSLSNSHLGCPTGCTVTTDWFLVGGWHWLSIDVVYPSQSVTGLTTFLDNDLHAHFVMMTQEQ
jgi:Flp pilus assembly protein TadG